MKSLSVKILIIGFLLFSTHLFGQKNKDKQKLVFTVDSDYHCPPVILMSACEPGIIYPLS